MPDVFMMLGELIEFFPLMAFVGLIVGGINLPISEDLIIITGALLSHERPELMFYNLLAIYLGVIVTDSIVYWVGTRARNGAEKASFLMRMIPEKALNKMRHFLDKYGILTFIVCRFIPFGVRNTLFFSAGFFKLRYKIFIAYDILASMISVNTLFFLTYHFGEATRKPLMVAGIVLFIAFVSAIILIIIRLIIIWREKETKKNAAA